MRVFLADDRVFRNAIPSTAVARAFDVGIALTGLPLPPFWADQD